MNLPNKITMARICMIPLFVVVFYLDVIPCNFLIAAVIFVLAALTDALDGHIARSRNLVTNLGKFLDPIADKVLVSTAFILLLTEPSVFSAPFLLFNGGADAVLSAETAMRITAGVCVAVILARELIVSGFRMVAAERKLVIAADKLGKIKTTCQDISIAVLLASMSFLETTAGQIAALVGLVFFFLCTFFTVLSGINYIVKNIQVLKESD